MTTRGGRGTKASTASPAPGPQFISNAGEADFLVVYAKTDMAAGSRGISAFLVERRSEGFRDRAAGAHDGTEGWPRVRGGA